MSIQCADVARSSAFYDAFLAPLGGARVMEFGEVIGYGVPPMPDFWLGPNTTGEGFRESHLAFAAPDRAAVHAIRTGVQRWVVADATVSSSDAKQTVRASVAGSTAR